MKCYVGVTDYEWFSFLAAQAPDEVNFWSPSDVSFKALASGEMFLFKLHSPRNFIAGGGFFVSHHSSLPLSVAWDAFGTKNGAPDRDTCRARVRKYTRRDDQDPKIGCTILTNPFFFDAREWIPAPASFKGPIVRGKGYTTDNDEGKALFSAVMARLDGIPGESQIVAEQQARYGSPSLTRPRLGQGAFRVLVTDAYQRRCAMTGERTLPVLDAAHIRPYSAEGPHDTRNGLLMRSDLHTLFDRGYLTVRPDYTIDVSPRLREEYRNGRIYYALRGQTLAVLPSRAIDRPSEEFLAWHNHQVFRP